MAEESTKKATKKTRVPKKGNKEAPAAAPVEPSEAVKKSKKREREEDPADATAEPPAKKSKVFLNVMLPAPAKKELLTKALKQALPNLLQVAFHEPWITRGLFATPKEAMAVVCKGTLTVLGEPVAVTEGGYTTEVEFHCRQWLSKQIQKASGQPVSWISQGQNGALCLSLPADTAGPKDTASRILKVAGVDVRLLNTGVPTTLRLHGDIPSLVTRLAKEVFPTATETVQLGRLMEVGLTFGSEKEAQAVYSTKPEGMILRPGKTSSQVSVSCDEYVRKKLMDALAPQGVLWVDFKQGFRDGSSRTLFVSLVNPEKVQGLHQKGKLELLGMSFETTVGRGKYQPGAKKFNRSHKPKPHGKASGK
eukprot:RCo005722